VNDLYRSLWWGDRHGNGFVQVPICRSLQFASSGAITLSMGNDGTIEFTAAGGRGACATDFSVVLVMCFLQICNLNHAKVVWIENRLASQAAQAGRSTASCPTYRPLSHNRGMEGYETA
jgi:hypothetical protein